MWIYVKNQILWKTGDMQYKISRFLSYFKDISSDLFLEINSITDR